ncbi:penicillin-binding protein activator [Rhodovarius lipocyclicus]|uniref:penicillin-binding protein activator n=1 Tax=Rhodovarius lipocyclicus TaxID=268410 RepID=UPI001358218A|nr:penicillin-binding protein activator [Rhodovarius lipocyclicus]
MSWGHPLARAALPMLMLMALIGCAPQVRQPAPVWQPGPQSQLGWQPGPAQAPALPATPQAARNRVGLLLPLSGSNGALGQAMLNAAQLALFDQADPRVEFLPQDTRSTSTGAAEAAREALAGGATVLVGPLTLGETAAAARTARAASVPMLAFTSDESQAGQGVYVLGVTPSQVGRRIVQAAQGAQRIGVLAQEDEFGRRLTAAIRDAAGAAGMQPPVVQLYRGAGTEAALQAFLAAANAAGGVQAVVLGVSGVQSRALAQGLAGSGLNPMPRLIGTQLWVGDSSIAQEPALAGALFVGPDPTVRAGFDDRYNAAFGSRPARLAGTAYDGAALASRAAREGGRELPVGEAFQGADGPIRLLPNGELARGLAILEVRRNAEPALREPAPVPAAAGS